MSSRKRRKGHPLSIPPDPAPAPPAPVEGEPPESIGGLMPEPDAPESQRNNLTEAHQEAPGAAEPVPGSLVWVPVNVLSADAHFGARLYYVQARGAHCPLVTFTVGRVRPVNRQDQLTEALVQFMGRSEEEVKVQSLHDGAVYRLAPDIELDPDPLAL